VNSLRFDLDYVETPIGRFAVVVGADGCVHAAGFTDGHARMEKQLRARWADRLELTPKRNPGGISEAVQRYFAGDLGAIEGLPVFTGGTEFQRDVWAALREIPCGETRSYGDVARRIGKPAATRAVGLANNANPVGVIVPCHRVIGADGSLTGYGGGIERKRWLLSHEAALSTAMLTGSPTVPRRPPGPHASRRS
jgi:methylated-DNA-[protein]-cysteine S-methyltransferase